MEQISKINKIQDGLHWIVGCICWECRFSATDSSRPAVVRSYEIVICMHISTNQRHRAIKLMSSRDEQPGWKTTLHASRICVWIPGMKMPWNEWTDEQVGLHCRETRILYYTDFYYAKIYNDLLLRVHACRIVKLIWRTLYNDFMASTFVNHLLRLCVLSTTEWSNGRHLRCSAIIARFSFHKYDNSSSVVSGNYLISRPAGE